MACARAIGEGSDTAAALSTGTITAANSSLPVVALEVCCLLAFCV
jgi:hypothetical protein